MTVSTWTVIGWDAAVTPSNNALVRATVTTGDGRDCTVAVTDHVVPTTSAAITDAIVTWSVKDTGPVLLCVDSPLGWPVPLGHRLAEHRAGEPVGSDPEHLFRRDTDRDIRARLGKTPLDIGADRIARTAWSVLDVIGAVRVRGLMVHVPTDYRWLRAEGRHPSPDALLFESYPAAWCASESVRTSGYRPAEAVARRAELLTEVRERVALQRIALDLPHGEQSFTRRADDLDALICVLVGVDIVRQLCPPPSDQLRAATEGWIWCKDRS